MAFVNHYLFKTFALDLGVYTNALYDYSHFQFNDKAVFKPVAENLLSDHFDLFLMMFAPLSWVFGQYTLQLVQILAILFGGVGVYRLIEVKSNNKAYALFAQLFFYTSFPIFAALSFDYHSNVPAAMLLPWVIYFAETKRYNAFIGLSILMWLAKETMSFWLVFVMLGLFIEYRKDKKLKQLTLWMSLLSLLYFILVLKFVMPSFANSGAYEHFKFKALGNDYIDAFKFVIGHPLDFIHVLVSNHLNKPEFEGIKQEFFMFVAFSGGIFLIARPSFLIMGIPLIVMKMCYDDPAAWSIDTHYSIELAPLLVLSVFYVINDIKQHLLKKILIIVSLIGCVSMTLKYMDNTVYWHDYSRVRIYQNSHYVKNYNVEIVHKQLNSLPKDAIISAQTPFVPHLAYRDKCYTIPIVKDAAFIVYSPSEEALYPIIREELNKQIGDSLNSGRWQYQYKDTNIAILKRIQP